LLKQNKENTKKIGFQHSPEKYLEKIRVSPEIAVHFKKNRKILCTDSGNCFYKKIRAREKNKIKNFPVGQAFLQSRSHQYRYVPFDPPIITRFPLIRVKPGVLKRVPPDPQKPRKMPGFVIGPFLKNPGKRPDSIRVSIVEEITNGVHYGVIMIRVDFPWELKEG
jgi:hypothetical protein